MAAAPFPLPLTPYERFMWRNERPGYPVVWSAWLALRGELSESLFDQAVAETIEWHPLLTAVIRGRGRKARWALESPARQRVAWTADSRSPIEPLDLSREPGLRIVGSKRLDGADLVFHFNHAASDGVGGIQFLGDLFGSYSQLAAGQSHAEPVRSLDPQALLGRYRGPASAPLRRRLGRGTSLAAWLPKALAFRPSVLAADPTRSAETALDAAALYRLPELRLQGDEVAALRALAREAKASLNDVLLAGALFAMRRWNAERGGGRRFRLMMPTNQRQPEQEEMPAANIVGFEPIDKTVRESTPWGTLLGEVRRQTAAVKQLRQPSLMDDWMASLAAAPPLLDGVLRLPSALYTAIVSNLGAPAEHFWSHLPQADGGKVLVGDAVLERVGFAPPVRPRSVISLGITAYGGQLSITGKACPRTFGAAGLERFLELLGEELRARTTAREEAA